MPSSEASAIAAVQELGNLTLFYDQNQISIEDDTTIALAEDVAARYEAYGWHVQRVDWTNGGTTYHEDVDALNAAIDAARAETGRPSSWPFCDARSGRTCLEGFGAAASHANKKTHF